MKDTDDQELQKILEQNERSKAFQKRVSFYYTGVYGLLGAWLLWSFILLILAGSRTGLIIGLCVFAILFIPWIVLCISSPLILRCPHCDSSLYRADPLHIQYCPYCKTDLKVRQYYGREKI